MVKKKKKENKLTKRPEKSVQWLQEVQHIYLFSSGDNRSFIGLHVFLLKQNYFFGILTSIQGLLFLGRKIYIYICT